MAVNEKNFPIAGYSALARRRGRRAKRAEARSNRIYARYERDYQRPTSSRSVRRANLEADRYVRDVERQERKGLFDNNQQPSGGTVTNS